MNKAHEKHINDRYDRRVPVHPQALSKGYLFLSYEHDKYTLGVHKFEPEWCSHYIVRHVLWKGSYELNFYEGPPLDECHNLIYLKICYS